MEREYNENYKTLIKEIKEHGQMKRYTMFLHWENLYCENDNTTQSNLKIQCNFYQNKKKKNFHRTKTNNFKIGMETQKYPK